MIDFDEDDDEQERRKQSPASDIDPHREDSDSESDGLVRKVVNVTFFPPLNDARRAWILSNLRGERVSSVLDVGCGAGTLLSCLCNSHTFFNPDRDAGDKEYPTRYCSGECEGLPELRISHLAGLDISRRALEKCIITTAPSDGTGYRSLPRWELLEVSLWQGSLDVYNEAFVNTECIVASEVIEHLPPSILPAFAPTLLGLYRPRLLLVTTPNFSFNARFSAPGTVDPAGFPDPTGRTDRVFRHSDHKFEWTPSEFRSWCENAASEWGYTVEVDAIGLPNEPDPWRRDEELGCASQVALFRRIEGWQGQRPEPSSPTQGQAHTLLTTHVHVPHPRAGIHESYDTVVDLVSKYMGSYYSEDGYTVWDLWVESSISIASGGRLDVFLDAIEASPELSLLRTEGAPARDWNVRFAGEKHREAVEKTKNTRYWDRTLSQNSCGHDGWQSQNEREDTDNSSDSPGPLYDWFQLAKNVSSEGAEAPWGSREKWDVEKLSPASEVWGQPVETLPKPGDIR